MSYQVLARKWRPHRFSELVGQEHVVRALSNALDHDRLHHAYLFTGTRGVGKTTLARILAKSLNCEKGVGSNPCGECSACRELDEGRFVDLIEVDAASRTKVDQTRELLENVPYAPVRGRYKVYLIDEVHMFSDSSFNALLKTLEEPPPHVKFLLATTDPRKMPITVLSRCLQFNLKRLTPEQIGAQLDRILAAEHVDGDPEATRLLALAADGSMRDALSLLDQAIVYGAGKVGDADVRAMLGTIDRGKVHGLLEALADNDVDALLQGVAGLAESAPDFSDVLKQLLRGLHQIALLQAVPEMAGLSLADDALRPLAERIGVEDVQLYYQIGLIGQRDLPLAPDARGGLEMVLLRMLAFRPSDAEGAPARMPAGKPASRATPRPQPASEPASAPGRTHAADASAPVAPGTPPPSAVAEPRAEIAASPPPGDGDWAGIVAGLKLAGISRELANNCVLGERDDDRLVLLLDPNGASLSTRSTRERLGKALNDYFGRSMRVEIRALAEQPGDTPAEKLADTPARQRERDDRARQRDAEQAIMRDPLVGEVQQAFDATPLSGSIRPVEAPADNDSQ